MTTQAVRPIGVEGFPVAGPIGPMPDGLDTTFWEGLEAGELRIQRCRSCSTWIWSPQWICHRCHSFDLGWDATPARGRVYTWTRTWQPFEPSFAQVGPFLTVLVELPQAGDVRILGCLADATQVTIGDEVVGVIQAPSELTGGVPVLRWRLATERKA